jgi:hypothetical protein
MFLLCVSTPLLSGLAHCASVRSAQEMVGLPAGVTCPSAKPTTYVSTDMLVCGGWVRSLPTMSSGFS